MGCWSEEHFIFRPCPSFNWSGGDYSVLRGTWGGRAKKRFTYATTRHQNDNDRYKEP